MPDREKTIKAIEICYTLGHNCTECPLFPEDNCNDKLMHDALTLLKTQEAVEPYIQCEILNMRHWHCGSCNVVITEGDKFCRMCGREVKWDEI